MYLSYFGIRVRDLPRSVAFYAELMGLRPADGSSVPTEPPSGPASVLLVDPVSGQRLELNYYPPGSPYATPYVPGEGWDHIGFRVDNLDELLAKLAARGIHPRRMKHYEGPMLSTPNFRVAYVSDPDDNEVELFDTPGDEPVRFDATRY